MSSSGPVANNEKADSSSLALTLLVILCYWTLTSTLSWLLRRLILKLLTSRSKTNTDQTSAPQSKAKSSTESPSTNANHHQVEPPPSPLLVALCDSLAAFEVCAFSLECWPVRRATNHNGLMLAIALGGWRALALNWYDAYGSPCNPWYRYLVGQSSLGWLLITWLLQLASASVALLTSQFWWSLQLTSYHAERHKLTGLIWSARLDSNVATAIQSDLHVSLLTGCLIEAGGICLDLGMALACQRLLVTLKQRRSTADGSNHLSSSADKNKQLETGLLLARQSVNLALISKCLPLTGAYLNPVNAFIQSFALPGCSPIDHLLVYWISPLVSVWLTLRIDRLLFYVPPTRNCQSSSRTCRTRLCSSTSPSAITADSQESPKVTSEPKHKSEDDCGSSTPGSLIQRLPLSIQRWVKKASSLSWSSSIGLLYSSTTPASVPVGSSNGSSNNVVGRSDTKKSE